MTYPPQQPGPYGQPDPYGQQPGWQGQGGYGPQQQPNYGGYGGYPGGQPPQKKTGLIVGLAIAGVLVVGGGVTAVLLLTGKDDNPTPAAQNGNLSPEGGGPAGAPPGGGGGGARAVVDQVIKAIEDKSSKDATATLCDPSTKTPAFQLDGAPATVTLKPSVVGEVRETGDTAATQLSIKISETGKTRESTVRMTLNLKKDGGRWCVSKASMSNSDNDSRTQSSARRPTSTPTF